MDKFNSKRNERFQCRQLWDYKKYQMVQVSSTCDVKSAEIILKLKL